MACVIEDTLMIWKLNDKSPPNPEPKAPAPKVNPLPKAHVTKLPDGSAFWTADVLSKDEAMALPVEQRPLSFRISSEMYHAVFEAIGSASMCWKPRPGKEVFGSEEASKIATDLCFKIAVELEKVQALLTSQKDRNAQLVRDLVNLQAEVRYHQSKAP